MRDEYLGASLAENSTAVYQTGLRTYLRFCGQVGLSPFPLRQGTLELFVTFLSKRVGFASIRVYLSGYNTSVLYGVIGVLLAV